MRIFLAQFGQLVAVFERVVPLVKRAGPHVFDKTDQRVVLIQFLGYHRLRMGKERIVPEIIGQGRDVPVEALHQFALVGSVERGIHAGKVFGGRIDQQVVLHTRVGFRHGTVEFRLFVLGASHPHNVAGKDHAAEQGFAEINAVGIHHGVPARERIGFAQQVAPAGLALRIGINPSL